MYLFLVFCCAGSGKRMLAQLNPFDLVVLLTLSNTVQNAIIGNDTSLLGGADRRGVADRVSTRCWCGSTIAALAGQRSPRSTGT